MFPQKLRNYRGVSVITISSFYFTQRYEKIFWASWVIIRVRHCSWHPSACYFFSNCHTVCSIQMNVGSSTYLRWSKCSTAAADRFVLIEGTPFEVCAACTSVQRPDVASNFKNSQLEYKKRPKKMRNRNWNTEDTSCLSDEKILRN